MLDTLKLAHGNPNPLGMSVKENLHNFALISTHAKKIFLVLQNGTQKKEFLLNQTGTTWHIEVHHIPPSTQYAFRLEGPHEPDKGMLYQSERILGDPYSKAPATPTKWNTEGNFVFSDCQPPSIFDWENIQKPQLPLNELILYEMHVRGFTQDPSSQSGDASGTFLGILQKLPHLKKLGINAIQLMPVFEFKEREFNVQTNQARLNYWGYNPLYFFAPMRRFASTHDPMREFKTLVKELHKEKIEVFLDVVYNHTGEGKDVSSTVSFRGIDNALYYMLDPKGCYLDFSGCFNTFNCNHPVVQELILDSLHFWTEEMQIDGFRFDLASILTRNTDGTVSEFSPLLQKIQTDPVLKKTKLIAEPWDASGLYQVGSFPKWGHWSEWNGVFRDSTRRFIKGTDGLTTSFANSLCGSQSLYAPYSPLSSVNFITVHDGFTLRDLVSYQDKHNFGNGEQNQDGNPQNDSWNCGQEGMSNDPLILALREQQMRNFLVALLISQGIPLFLMGDEYGHTRGGNNNPYVQDNRLNWFLWDELEKRKDIFDFVADLIAFRKAHPVLRQTRFLTDADISWHGRKPFCPDWSHSCRFIAFTLNAPNPLLIAFNANYQPIQFELPHGWNWKEVVRTELPWTHHVLKNPEQGKPLFGNTELKPYSAIILKA